MQQIYTFGLAESVQESPSSQLPALAQVGGKGWSLMRMAEAGLAVPPGLVLGVAFFAGWIAELQATSEWQAFLSASTSRLASACDALKARAAGLKLAAGQRQALAEPMQSFAPDSLFAVRSSSPEEDLEGASFAGAYETVLGVRADGLEDAIRRAFASCLDSRIVVYKQQHGFDARQPRIAVIVQQQIQAETAGVGFSLNPLSNDFDQAMISANWGLGESVVAGLASPDLYVLDKLGPRLLERRRGRKELAILPEPDGGTREAQNYRSREWTLSEAQALELAEMLSRLESLYQKPIDIEWAFAGGKLYLLQARPITSHMPLPAELLTLPGAPKRLYGDFTISIQGIFEPMSVLGTDFFRYLVRGLVTELLGHDNSDRIETAILFATTGRIYFNFSNLLALAGQAKIVALLKNVDGLAAAIMADLDAAPYLNTAFEKGALLRDLLAHIPGRALLALESGLMPEQARQGAERSAEKFQHLLAELAGEDLPLDAFGKELGEKMGHLLGGEFLPPIALSRVAIAQLAGFFADAEGGIADQRTRAYLQRLDRSLPHNVTIEMGLELENLARLLHSPLPEGPAALAARIAEGRLPQAFLDAWRSFLIRYGHRGPREIDAAAPRYREQPEMLLAQILQLAQLPDASAGPNAIYQQSRRERQAAYEALLAQVQAQGWLQAKKFETLYRIVETLGGYRERPKFELVKGMALCRAKVLAVATELVSAGRLDKPEQAFDLTLADLTRAQREPELDLRALAAERRRPIDRLARLPRLPQIFDSRGRIFEVPRAPAGPGELAGQAISAGAVRGRVKVLHSPTEKPLLPGEILVARATDPGWTPLFVNAAAIVLEVGGLLQHGALVAREYGKPCVAGVDQATEKLHDGQLVEVDGSAGVIRLLEAESAMAGSSAGTGFNDNPA